MTKLTFAVLVGATVVASTACRMNVDTQAFIEREEKRFPVDALADLSVNTFDGSVEIRSWDRAEVLVEIEKRGQDKDAVSKITVTAEQKGNHISVEALHTGRTTMIGIGHFTSTSARLIVSVPRKINVTARTGDGSITLDRVEGKINLRSGDGSIKVLEGKGDLMVETGDGTLTLDDVAGHVEARTSDGSVRVSGTPGSLRVRTGDGSVSLRIRDGAQMTEDWMIDTGDGSVTAELPSNFNALIDADPGSDGRVHSDFTLTNTTGASLTGKSREHGPVSGQLGTGGKRLTLRTGDGTIRITNY
ncbi:MAG: DUF4097 family beta strand repeat-containing protein [Acidobacteriota bacterium]